MSSSSRTNRSKSKAEISKTLSSLLNQKHISWHKVKIILKHNSNGILDSLRRQALTRACLDPFVCQICLKLLLQKTDLTVSQRIKYAIVAVRCHNLPALETIVYDDVSVLYHTIPYVDRDGDGIDSSGRDGGSTLLHRVCDAHGWNEEVIFVLKETLENSQDGEYPHEGMFEGGKVGGKNFETPLVLAIQAGADLGEIVDHLRREYPFYFEQKSGRLPVIIAEYCYDMTLFCELMDLYPCILNSLHPNGSSPLHFACYYQNEDMIQTLLDKYQKLEGRKVLLQKRLLTLNEEDMSPLGYLVLNVGDRDDGNAWRCINFVIEAEYVYFPLFHLVCYHMLDAIAKKPNCMKIIRQIVTRLQVDLCHVDEVGRTVLSILIVKMASCEDIKTRLFAMQILDYILEGSMNTASIKDGSGRLPLHVACEHGISWNKGLEKLVKANVTALDTYDPVTCLAPFALLAATGEQLDSVYRLLRQHPNVI